MSSSLSSDRLGVNRPLRKYDAGEIRDDAVLQSL
jgi:hypothetical protein